MARETLIVRGEREFLHACDHGPRDTKKFVRSAFREIGNLVKTDAADRFGPFSARSAAGFRTVVRQRGVSVEQSLRKTTGTRPDWGATQMRKALLPALEAKEQEVEAAFDRAIDKVADHFDGKA